MLEEAVVSATYSRELQVQYSMCLTRCLFVCSSALISLFESREAALRAGIWLRGLKFAVHRWETVLGVDLVYGRTGDAVSGCGAAVARVDFSERGEDSVFVAISYKFPVVSASAVSKLVSFSRDVLPKLRQTLPQAEPFPITY